ncbi:hypothetical protein E3P92_01295 [Wallemia ichthyophaga]|uniref:Uncharacterized protein n=1 Tax=Wallemia ichthyophaga (strain EXF-994 / CBS 113033) TaxID=1299270 RepID=R9ABR2_WALI9|nr:uncharacterized protein J056_001480 [Wallemia ichthyophaga EXF-994]TIA74231.1 hypothetical protein E3P91_01003 [Wallemia ichthyophaga]EOQ99648.1 hypothetical protein J056_001480 [Wallemia ichthyophaga EXF-994]TIA82741.1 hypothetical protein E3P98_01244 [Wallemia ichthyophaga]TIA92586.1 hypothetical protein E3P97_01309 [Wallemia ichthyophaga]TIB01755.1 hypothetical protein E3P95_01146 [Wallemia ichthyophaga]
MSDEFLILDELLSYTRELNKQNKQSAQSTQITHNSQPAPSVAGKSKNPGPKGVKKKPWSLEETYWLEHYLQLYYTTLKGQPPWAYIRNRHGKNGTVDQTLAKRSHIDLQDKARIMSGKLWREGKDIPEWLIAAKPPKRILDKMRPTRGEWPKRQSDSANSSLSQQESSSHHASPQTSTPQSPAPPIAFTSDANVFSQGSFTTDTFNH